MTVKTAECQRCRREFEPRRKGHIYCSRECRYASEHAVPTVQLADPAAVDRLFDPKRDPAERVRPDDWYVSQPENCDDETWEMFAELDRSDTVAKRRRWYI